MTYLPDTEARKLLEEAKAACANTYSPYSRFMVGAAVLARDGSVYHGTNVENSSYGMTMCAERTAVGNAISAGQKDIVAVAVYAPVDSISPCGACRQFIIEFGVNIIVIFRSRGNVVQKLITEMLPFQFKMPG